MDKIEFGTTGLVLSKIGFGGIPIQRISMDEAEALIHNAVERGITWMDTAHTYGDSEEKIGNALTSLDRENIAVFTKAPGRTPEDIVSQVETSLERLQTEYIDVYQFHGVPGIETWEEMIRNGTLNAMEDLKHKGVIRHIGASFHYLDTALAAMEHPSLESVQYPLNFIMEEDGLKVLEKCREKKIGFISMKPFGGGVLEHASVCIRYQMQFPYAVADPGFEKKEEVEEVVRIAEGDPALTPEDKQVIDHLRKDLGTRFCRRCGYCEPCEQGVSIIALNNMDSLIKRMSADRVIQGWSKAADSLDSCTECRACEEKCPYDLPVIHMMNRGKKLFLELKNRL